jgi:hypothetical protein
MTNAAEVTTPYCSPNPHLSVVALFVCPYISGGKIWQ